MPGAGRPFALRRTSSRTACADPSANSVCTGTRSLRRQFGRSLPVPGMLTATVSMARSSALTSQHGIRAGDIAMHASGGPFAHGGFNAGHWLRKTLSGTAFISAVFSAVRETIPAAGIREVRRREARVKPPREASRIADHVEPNRSFCRGKSKKFAPHEPFSVVARPSPPHCTGKTDRRTVHRSTGGMNINQPVPAVRQIK